MTEKPYHPKFEIRYFLHALFACTIGAASLAALLVSGVTTFEGSRGFAFMFLALPACVAGLFTVLTVVYFTSRIKGERHKGILAVLTCFNIFAVISLPFSL